METRLLIVEDHPMVRESLRMVLASPGNRCCKEASTCAEALQFVKEQSFDLVLLDLALPDGNGLDVLLEIRAIHRELPVLIHSSNDESWNLARGYCLGASGYLVKGIDSYRLLDAVQEASRGGTVWTEEQLGRIGQSGNGHGNGHGKRGSRAMTREADSPGSTYLIKEQN